jgi:O-antigen ligase
VIVAGASEARPGPLDLYRTIWATGTAWTDRRWVRTGVEVGFIATWLLLRLSGSHPALDGAWTAAAVGLSLLAPGSGLVVLVAIAPWNEPLTLGHALGLRNLLPPTLGVSVGLRILARPRSMPWSPPTLAAVGLLAVTLLLGVGTMYSWNGRSIGWDSATFWLAGFGGAMLVLLVAVWLGYHGDRRPLWAAVIAATVAGLLSLVDYLLPNLLGDLSLQALLSDREFGGRLAGAIASPPAMVSLLIAPTAVFAAALVLAQDRRLRIAAAVLLPALLATLALTYSRAAILAVFAVAVIVLWRWRRRVGAGLLVVGLLVGVALTPVYLQTRANALGGSAVVQPGRVLIAGDEQRITAWGAAARMWLDQPLLGHGFRSYKILAPAYGDPVLGSPHNEWLRLFAEEGIAAGILGVAFLVLVAGRLARSPGWLATGALGAFIGWAITATFNNPFLFLQVNAIVFTVAGIALGFGQRAGVPDGPAPAGDPEPPSALKPSNVPAPEPPADAVGPA